MKVLWLLVVFITCALSETVESSGFRSEKRWLQEKQSVIEEFELWSPDTISSRVQRWASHYPDFIRVTTSQEAYGLTRAGGADDCPHDEGGDGCLNYIFTIQDYQKHPEGSESSNKLPEVLWSGEVHGNEQVGPTAVLEAAGLLLDAATCTTYPRMAVKNDGDEAWKKELETARECRADMQQRGISDEHMKWLARLVSTRRLVVVPTANALGYFRKVREENGIDPNRDFPYDLSEPADCMQTIAARTLNEVFREHMFQLSLTFHGGMEVIGYEWGAPTYLHKDSPDDIAQHNIAGAYSRFAGSFGKTKSYDYGSMNSLVYPVNGGMEDWAYAASWDPDRVIQCAPNTFGGYPAEKTTYDESTLRVFNMLVETSNHKIPSKATLGTTEDLMNADTPGNGHISRNIRLALLALELVQPYLTWKMVNTLSLTDDIIPQTQDTAGRECQSAKLVTVPSGSESATLKWTVGGSLRTDMTQLWFARWEDIDQEQVDCSQQPSFEYVRSKFQMATMVSANAGTNQFSSEKSTVFEAKVDLSGFEKDERIIVLAAATVDQNWSAQGDASKLGPNMKPQSHIVNARTNDNWHHEKDGKVIQGRLVWFSSPITIRIGQPLSGSVTSEQSSDGTVDETYRAIEMPSSIPDSKPDPTATTTSDDDSTSLSILKMMIFVIVGSGLFVGGRVFLRGKMRSSRREQIRDFIEEAPGDSPGQKKKGNGRDYSDIASDDEIELGEYS